MRCTKLCWRSVSGSRSATAVEARRDPTQADQPRVCAERGPSPGQQEAWAQESEGSERGRACCLYGQGAPHCARSAGCHFRADPPPHPCPTLVDRSASSPRLTTCCPASGCSWPTQRLLMRCGPRSRGRSQRERSRHLGELLRGAPLTMTLPASAVLMEHWSSRRAAWPRCLRRCRRRQAAM